MSRQATRCNDTQRHLHTQRQRALGERMAADRDLPRWPEVVAVLAILFAASLYLFPLH